MTRSHAAARDAGTKLERDTASYLAEVTGAEVVRRQRTGQDRGDIHGVYLGDGRIVVECKAIARIALASWWAEANAERANDGALAAIVVHKRVGKGQPADQWVTMTLGEFAALLTGTRDHLKIQPTTRP